MDVLGIYREVSAFIDENYIAQLTIMAVMVWMGAMLIVEIIRGSKNRKEIQRLRAQLPSESDAC